MTTLSYHSLTDASKAIEIGETSSTALVEAALARVEETDSRLNSFVRLMEDSAYAESEAATDRANSGRRLSPLDGIPIAVKDLYDTAEVVTAG